MTTLPDLRSLDHFNQEASGHSTLTLPIGGRDYTWTLSTLSIRGGLMLAEAQARMDLLRRKIAAKETVDQDADLLEGVSDEDFQREIIGSEKIDQMAADGVRWAELQFVGIVLLAWHLNGTAAAQEIWLGGQDQTDPKAPASGSTKTAGSSTRKKPPARRSTGSKSSPRGTSSKPTSNASTDAT